MLTKFCFFFLLFSPVAAFAGENLTPLFKAYNELQTALAGDDLQAAKPAIKSLKTATHEVNVLKLAPAIQSHWKKQADHLSMALNKAGTANDLNGIRKSFEHISNAMIALSKVSNPTGLIEYQCPMAFENKGANWLQKGGTTANPYFGSMMLRCGGPVNQGPKKANHGHDHHEHP